MTTTDKPQATQTSGYISLKRLLLFFIAANLIIILATGNSFLLFNIALIFESPIRFLDLRPGKPYPELSPLAGCISLVTSFGALTTLGLMGFRSLFNKHNRSST